MGGHAVTSRRVFYESFFLGTLASPSRADAQLAYELQVWKQGGALAWASGRTAGDAQSIIVPVALDSDETFSWRVRAWMTSRPDQPTAWGCKRALFDTAPRAAVFPGNAAWIGGGGQLRTTSEGGLRLPNGTVARARAVRS